MGRLVLTISSLFKYYSCKPALPPRVKSTAMGLGLLPLAVFFADTVYAQAWVVTPSISLGQEYDDNFRLSTDSPTDQVYTTVLSGAVEVSRLTEIWQLRGFGQYDAIHYEGDDDDLADKHNQFAGFSSIYETQRGELALEGSYRRDSILRALNFDVDPGGVIVDPGDDIDVDLVQRQIRRERFIIGPAWRRNLTELTQLELSYEFQDTSYDDPEGLDLIDFSKHTVSAGLARELSPLTSITTTAAVDFYRGDEEREYDNYSFVGGVDREFTQTTRGGAGVGFRYTSFDTPDEDGDELGVVGFLYGERRTQLGRYFLRYEKQLLPSGAGELLDSDLVTARVNRELRPRLDFFLRGRFFRNRSELENSSADRYYFSIQPGLTWEFTRAWSLDASYRFDWEERDIDDDSANTHIVFVALNYSWPALGQEE